MSTYNLWKPGNGNQRLELVIREYLEVFREIMLDPWWLKHFNLQGSRFALVLMLEVATNRAAEFIRFPAGLSGMMCTGIARQELSLCKWSVAGTIRIEKYSPVCSRHRDGGEQQDRLLLHSSPPPPTPQRPLYLTALNPKALSPPVVLFPNPDDDLLNHRFPIC